MALEGKNTCAFTYGASGSGKTYTIMGGQGDQAGVLPRTVSALFNCLDEKLGKGYILGVFLRSQKFIFSQLLGLKRWFLLMARSYRSVKFVVFNLSKTAKPKSFQLVRQVSNGEHLPSFGKG